MEDAKASTFQIWIDCFLNFLSSCNLRMSMRAKLLQSCPIRWDPPGSSVHGILQARILEWVAMPSSPGDLLESGIEHTSHKFLALAGGPLPLVPQGKPTFSPVVFL